MGDAIERGYGDLAWRGVEAERHLPWYAGHTAVLLLALASARGLRPCAWLMVDEEGITLDLDCRSGGVSVQLGGRDLHLATIHSFESGSESPFTFAQRFCRALPGAAPASHPVYGANNWYYACGHSSQQSLLG